MFSSMWFRAQLDKEDEDAVSSEAMLPPPPPPVAGAEAANREPAPAYTEHPDSTAQSRLRTSGRFERSEDFIRETDTHSMVTLPAGGVPETHKRNHYLTSAFCHIYGIFFITLGLLITVSDPFSHYSYTPTYAIILCIVGLIYLVYLVIDIGIEEVKDKRAQKQADGDVSPRKNQHYTFDLSKHASNFYLKLGAAGFALGHLVHFALLFMIQYSFMAVSWECVDVPTMVLDVIYPIYSFVQLIFIFKYNNIIILRHKILARFGFMQFIASSITFWVWSIARETQLAMYAYEYNKKTKDNQTSLSMVDRDPNAECFRLSPTVQLVFKNFSPYLFPFTVEFNIIMVGFFLIIWLNIGKNIDNEKSHSIIGIVNTPGSVYSLDMLDGQPSKFMIYADCHASSRGIMAGFLVLVITVAHLMIGFILANINQQSLTTAAVYISDSTKLGLHTLMLVTVIAAFVQTRKLDVNPHPISSVDDILLLMCIPGFILDSTLTMFATVHYVNVIKFIDSAINGIQVLLQTAFLIDRMRRCSNTRELRRSKPGRQLIMFLLIVNVTMWIFNTFSYKSPQSFDERYEFYGKKVWTVLGHVSLPLIMFYRFHSSVCLADIWQLGYQTSQH